MLLKRRRRPDTLPSKQLTQNAPGKWPTKKKTKKAILPYSLAGAHTYLLKILALHARALGLRAAGPDKQLREAGVEHVVREVRLRLF